MRPSSQIKSIKRGEFFQSRSSGAPETERIGRLLGASLTPGDTVLLYGGLGAGKTVFVKGIASAFEVKEYVASPTFTIVNEYEGTRKLYHFDAYRIKSPAELFETGFFEFSGGNCIVVVEWGERLGGLKPDSRVEVAIDRASGSDAQRDITISWRDVQPL